MFFVYGCVSLFTARYVEFFEQDKELWLVFRFEGRSLHSYLYTSDALPATGSDGDGTHDLSVSRSQQTLTVSAYAELGPPSDDRPQYAAVASEAPASSVVALSALEAHTSVALSSVPVDSHQPAALLTDHLEALTVASSFSSSLSPSPLPPSRSHVAVESSSQTQTDHETAAAGEFNLSNGSGTYAGSDVGVGAGAGVGVKPNIYSLPLPPLPFDKDSARHSTSASAAREVPPLLRQRPSPAWETMKRDAAAAAKGQTVGGYARFCVAFFVQLHL